MLIAAQPCSTSYVLLRHQSLQHPAHQPARNWFHLAPAATSGSKAAAPLASSSPTRRRSGTLPPSSATAGEKQQEVELDAAGYPVVDWNARAQQKDIEEITAAARKARVSEAAVIDSIAALRTLLPGFHPSPFAMKARDWALLLQNPSSLAAAVLAIKGAYGGADAAAMVSRRPQLLGADPVQVAEDAKAVREMLRPLSDAEFAALIAAAPSMSTPITAQRALSWLISMYGEDAALGMLREDPAKALTQLGESTEEADAEYGEDINSNF